MCEVRECPTICSSFMSGEDGEDVFDRRSKHNEQRSRERSIHIWCLLKGVLNHPRIGIQDVYITPLPCPHLHQLMSINYLQNFGVFLTSPPLQCGRHLRTALRWFASQRVSLLKTWTITVQLQGRYINGKVPGGRGTFSTIGTTRPEVKMFKIRLMVRDHYLVYHVAK